MTIQLINIGALPNDGTGDPLRVAFEKINNNFVTVSNTTIAAGPDGSVQYRATNGLRNVAYRSVAAGSGNVVLPTWIAIGTGGAGGSASAQRWWRSDNGQTWAEFAAPTTETINYITNTSTGFVGVGVAGTLVSSADGVTWYTPTTNITTDLTAIASSGSLFVAVGPAGTVYTSNNATAWTPRAVGFTTADMKGVAWGGSTTGWAAVGTNGTVLYSADGVSWAVASVPTTATLTAITAIAGVFYASASDGAVWSSVDGATWALRPTGSTESLYGIGNATLSDGANSYATLIAVGSNSTIHSSVDGGLNWVTTTATDGPTLYSVVGASYANTTLATVVGNSGAVYSGPQFSTWNNVSIPGTLSGNINLTYDPAIGLSLAGNLLPGANNTYTIGTFNNRWSSGYFGPNSVYIGQVALRSNALSLTLSDGANVLANITGDTATFNNINANSAGISANLAVGDNLSVGNSVSANRVAANTANITNIAANTLQTLSAVVSNTLSATNVVSSTITAGNVGVASNLVVGDTVTTNTLQTTDAIVDGNLTVNGAFNFPSGNLTVNSLTANTLSGRITTPLQPDIVQVGTLLDLTVANTIVGNITGSANSANFTYYTEQANTANTVIQAAQPNITSVGTLTSLNVSGPAAFTGNTLLEQVTIVNGNITGTLTGNFAGNILGNVTNAFQAQQSVRANIVVDAAQPNITSLGTLTGLTVSGDTALANTIAANITATGTVVANNFTALSNINSAFVNALSITAGSFTGEGSNLSNITGANVVGAVALANSALTSGTVTNPLQPNITAVGTLSNLAVSGNVDAPNAFLGNVTGNNATFANITGTLTTAVQPNITAVGTLGNLVVSGDTTTGNLTVTDSTILSNVSAGNASISSTLTAVFVNTNELTANTINGNVVVAAAPNSVLFSRFDPTLTANVLAGNAGQISWNGNTLTVNGNVTANFYTGTLTQASSNQSNIQILGNLRDLQVGYPGISNGTGAYSGFLRVYGNSPNHPGYSAEFSGGKVFASEGAVVADDFTVKGGNTYWEGPVNVAFDLANTASHFSIGGNLSTIQGPGAGGIIDVGTGTRGGPLTQYVPEDRGIVTHYYANGVGDQGSALIWKTANSQFELYRTSVRSGGFVTGTDYGNIKANWFYGNFAGNISNGSGNFDNLDVGNLNVRNYANFNGPTTITNVGNLHIPGGANGYVLATDGAGNLYWTPQTGGNGGGGGGLTLTSSQWQPGLGPATDAYYWNGTASVVNQKEIRGNFTLPANVTAANVVSINLNGTNVLGGTTLYPGNNSFEIGSTTIGNTLQTFTGAIALTIEIGGTSANGNATYGPATLTVSPQLVGLNPFTVAGTLNITPTSPVATPFWQPGANGNITVSGLSTSGGVLSNVTYTLLQGATPVEVSPIQTSFGTYVFSTGVGNGYSVSASINGSGTNGANPAVNTTRTSATANVLANVYYPVFQKTTTSNAVPTFTTSDTYVPQQFVSGSSVLLPNTTPPGAIYAWVATPTNTPRTFQFASIFGNIDITPDVSGNGTISGQAYNIYGFTDSLANTVLYII